MWRILIADDQENIRALVRTLLENEGSWEVCGEASDGSQTVELCKRLSPDLVVLDVQMTNLNGVSMNGFEAIRLIARNWPQIRILALSIDESVHFARAAEECGAHGFLSKVQSTAHLAEAVTALLRNGTYFVLPPSKELKYGRGG
jgi:DNA-binding NarL/FixJ family response regulator